MKGFRCLVGYERYIHCIAYGIVFNGYKWSVWRVDGCLFYQLMQDQKDSTSYAMMEFYQDARAIAVHERTPYFKSEVRKTGPLMQDKMKITFMKTNYGAASKL